MKAIVVGATGMVGKELVKSLLNQPEFDEIRVFVRRPVGLQHTKLKEMVVNFDQMHTFESSVTGDVIFLCMGTTLAKAGSKENQFKVDYTYQLNIAKAASKNGVEACVLVSSAGADASSPNFYLGMKGKLENALNECGFLRLSVLRPGQLYGNREEKRWAEEMALKIMLFFNNIGLFRRYRPIHAREVSTVMINFALQNKVGIVTLNELFREL